MVQSVLPLVIGVLLCSSCCAQFASKQGSGAVPVNMKIRFEAVSAVNQSADIDGYISYPETQTNTENIRDIENCFPTTGVSSCNFDPLCVGFSIEVDGGKTKCHLKRMKADGPKTSYLSKRLFLLKHYPDKYGQVSGFDFRFENAHKSSKTLSECAQECNSISFGCPGENTASLALSCGLR